jgi:hypothetical protein
MGRLIVFDTARDFLGSAFRSATKVVFLRLQHEETILSEQNIRATYTLPGNVWYAIGTLNQARKVTQKKFEGRAEMFQGTLESPSPSMRCIQK